MGHSIETVGSRTVGPDLGLDLGLVESLELREKVEGEEGLVVELAGDQPVLVVAIPSDLQSGILSCCSQVVDLVAAVVLVAAADGEALGNH